MAISAYPIGKIAVYGLKQIATPLSRVLNTFAQNNRVFKTYICAPAGQLIYWVETRSKMRMLRLPQPKRIPKVSENMAIRLGANLLSEVFIVFVSVLLICIETSWTAKRSQIKHDNHKMNQEQLLIVIDTLNNLLDWQKKQIDSIRDQLNYCETYRTNNQKL